VWPGGAERLDLGIASMERVLADDAAGFGSAVSVRWLKYALLHPALPACRRRLGWRAWSELEESRRSHQSA
jgi:hypothetical protein